MVGVEGVFCVGVVVVMVMFIEYVVGLVFNVFEGKDGFVGVFFIGVVEDYI